MVVNEEPAVDATILRRVRKLLDKAERTSNEHEAEAFARKAADLVARHRLDPARLAAGDDGDLQIRRLPLGRGAYVRARLALLMAVASSTDVSVVFETTPAGTVALLAGFRADLDVTEVMFHSLHQQAAARMGDIRRGTPAATQRYRRSFLFGFAARLRDMLDESRRSAEVASTATGAAVDLRRRSAQVDEFLRARLGRIGRARPVSAVQAGGWDAGVRAANGADIGRSRLPTRDALGSGR